MNKHEFWWKVYTAAVEGIYAAGVPAGEEAAVDAQAAKAADIAMARLVTQYTGFFSGKAW